MKKIIQMFMALIICGAFVSGQSLAELSKKEKARRASLKGKKTVILKNSDLLKNRNKITLEVMNPDLIALGESEETGEAEAPPEEVETSEEGVSSDQEAAPPAPPPAEAATEEKLALMVEYIELLELKMNALWQEFYSMDDMTSKDSIQKQIFETNQKLEKAREDAEKMQNELAAKRR